MIARLIYDIAIRTYTLGIFLAQPFSHKARLWYNGRKDLPALPISHDDKIIWIHAASLGEFEQGRPIIEYFRSKYPEFKILLTFFSPSGYEVRKSYASADLVTYLPIDTRERVSDFLDRYNPNLAIFIKYEIWYHFLNSLAKRQIPTLLVSAQFRPNQFFFKRTGQFLLKQLAQMHQIFVTNEKSYKIARQFGLDNITVAGDTRIDRVVHVAKTHRDFSWLKAFFAQDKIFVCGSTWPKDEELISAVRLESGMGLLIAPHVISESRIQQLNQTLNCKSARLSSLSPKDIDKYDAIIVDTMGDLSHLYQLADLAYVGGGFNAGIHNILEPIAFGIPVLFGPKHDKFSEAKDLITAGCATTISDVKSLSTSMAYYADRDILNEVNRKIDAYLSQHSGDTERICTYIINEGLLTDAVD